MAEMAEAVLLALLLNESVKMGKIPDEALVVRGGRNRIEDLERGEGVHPNGIKGYSVECAPGKTMEELAKTLPHPQVGVTTVEKVRKMGGDVIRTSGKSPNHSTLTGLTPEQANSLLTPTVSNPNRPKRANKNDSFQNFC